MKPALFGVKSIPAACKQVNKFRYDNPLVNYIRYWAWNYGWGGREYGLQYHDLMFESAPEVKEAIRRLSLREPWEYDARVKRLINAHIMSSNNEKLDRKDWTKWDDETFYLHDYLVEVLKEKKARAETSGLKASFQLFEKKWH